MTSDAVALFIYVMTEFGFVYVVGHAAISQRPREILFGDGNSRMPRTRRLLVTMIECPACLGFHVGWMTGATCGLDGFKSILLGFFTSGVNVVLGKLTKLMN